MQFKDYYETLGVARDATAEEVKRAYRKLARKYHPDVSKLADAEERFKEVGEAYEVLQDAEKRAAYDTLGDKWREAGQPRGDDFRPPPDWDQGFEFKGRDAGDLHDFFETLFGQRGPQSHRRTDVRRPGEDHHAKVAIEIEDAYRGVTRTITLRQPVMDAQGHVSVAERQLSVTIPKGVREGQHLRLAGQGGPGDAGAPTGDLFLEISFLPHKLYRVDGRNVSLDLPIAPWEAALGATVTAPTPLGPIELTVPAGSVQGRKLRLKGRGLPGEPPGDLYAVLSIALPPATSEAARDFYAQWEKTLPFNPRESMGV